MKEKSYQLAIFQSSSPTPALCYHAPEAHASLKVFPENKYTRCVLKSWAELHFSLVSSCGSVVVKSLRVGPVLQTTQVVTTGCSCVFRDAD